MAIAEALPVTLRNAARELYEKGVECKEIYATLNVKPSTLSMWRKRGNWQRPTPVIHKVAVTLGETGPLAQESSAARLALAEAVGKVTQRALAEASDKRCLENTRERQGLVAVLKTAAETAAIVFDWKSASKPGVLIVAGTQPKPFTDISATVARPGDPPPKQESLNREGTPTPSP